jgi:hypothetical protein
MLCLTLLPKNTTIAPFIMNDHSTSGNTIHGEFTALAPASMSEAIVRAWSVERGAGSGDFESGEQELLSKFDKYQNSARNRNLDGNFLPNILFLVKIGTYYRGCRRPFTLFNGRNTVTFFGLESCTAFNNRKAVPATTSISARTWCPRPPVGTKFHPWILAMCTDL